MSRYKLINKSVLEKMSYLMPMEKDILIIGCSSYVSAIYSGNGQELWRTKLREGVLGGSRGSDVSVLIDGGQVFAGQQH